jgi:hypothetical protein
MAVLMLVSLTGARAADEISANLVLKVTAGFLENQRNANKTFSITNAAPNVAAATEIITTNGATALNFEDVSTPGWTWFRNLNVTGSGNDILIGVVDSNAVFITFGRLEPGEYAIMRLGTAGVYAQASGTNASSSRLEKFCLDD